MNSQERGRSSSFGLKSPKERDVVASTSQGSRYPEESQSFSGSAAACDVAPILLRAGAFRVTSRGSFDRVLSAPSLVQLVSLWIRPRRPSTAISARRFNGGGGVYLS